MAFQAGSGSGSGSGSVLHYDIEILRNCNGICPHGELEEMPLSFEISNSRSSEKKRS